MERNLSRRCTLFAGVPLSFRRKTRYNTSKGYIPFGKERTPLQKFHPIIALSLIHILRKTPVSCQTIQSPPSTMWSAASYTSCLLYTSYWTQFVYQCHFTGIRGVSDCGQYLLNIESKRQSRGGRKSTPALFFCTRIGPENCGDIQRLQNAAFFSKMLSFLGRSIVLEVEGTVESKTVDPPI